MKIGYVIIPFITILVAWFGGWFTRMGMSLTPWYQTLQKPSWTPGGSTIGIIWIIIFILATKSALIVWSKRTNDNCECFALSIFLFNAALNLSWSYIFFLLHLTGVALIVSMLLEITVTMLMIIVWSKSKIGALLLAPYFLWVMVATYLNYMIWMMNA